LVPEQKGDFMFHLEIGGASHCVCTAARCIAVGICTTALLGAAAALVGMTTANAKPEFSAQTKLPCGQCHTNPSGSGKLKAFGEKFKANGYKVK
jgi:hypothetical protein